MLQRILVAVDESPSAQRALNLAVALGRTFGSELVLSHAVDRASTISIATTLSGAEPALQDILDEQQSTAEELLQRAAGVARSAGVHAGAVVLDGRPADALLAYVRHNAVDAIVMGTQGKRGLERAFLGSTAETVLRNSDVPAFVVHLPDVADTAIPPIGSTTPLFRRILVALDASEQAEAALDLAIDLAAGTQTRLVCCTALDTRELLDKAVTYGYSAAPMVDELQREAETLLERRSDRARARGIESGSIIAHGKPAEAVLRAAHDQDVDLIAIGTHGRHGIHRMLVGSVAESVVRRSHIPVVVVRTAKVPARH
jgi:nucleotide-binding universal stress UspA family protein